MGNMYNRTSIDKQGSVEICIHIYIYIFKIYILMCVYFLRCAQERVDKYEYMRVRICVSRFENLARTVFSCPKKYFGEEFVALSFNL